MCLQKQKSCRYWLFLWFLVACTQLYKPLCRSVRWSVRWSVGRSLFTTHATYGDRPCLFHSIFLHVKCWYIFKQVSSYEDKMAVGMKDSCFFRIRRFENTYFRFCMTTLLPMLYSHVCKASGRICKCLGNRMIAGTTQNFEDKYRGATPIQILNTEFSFKNLMLQRDKWSLRDRKRVNMLTQSNFFCWQSRSKVARGP